MPAAAAIVCRCGRRRGRGRACPSCDAGKRKPQANRPQYMSLYNNRRWRAKSLAQRQDQPLCAHCLRDGKLTPATVADHVQVHRGDPVLFWSGELESLCDHCHGRKSSLERQSIGPA